jgi:hypothetical protein
VQQLLLLLLLRLLRLLRLSLFHNLVSDTLF